MEYIISGCVQVSRLVIVTDPPFGVFVEPLMKSVQAIRTRHAIARYPFFTYILKLRSPFPVSLVLNINWLFHIVFNPGIK